jgi:phage-related protein
MANNLHYKITGDASGLKNSLSEAFENATKLAEAIGLVELAAKGLELIKDTLKESFNAFKENESAAHDLARSVSASGGLLSNFKDLTDQAGELAEKGIFSKKDIELADAMNLRLGLTSEQVKKLTPQLADLSAGFISKSGEKLSLERITGEFDKFIRTGNSKILGLKGRAGDTLGNEAIFEKFASQYKGANEDAAINTTEGKLKNLANAWEEIQVSIGSKIADLFSVALPYIKQFLGYFNQIGDWFNNHSDSINNLFSKIGAWIQPFGELFQRYFGYVGQTINDVFEDIMLLVNPIMELINFLKPYFLQFADAVIIFGSKLENLFQHIFKIGYSIYQILDKLGQFKLLGQIFEGVWDYIKGIADLLEKLYDNIISPLLDKFEAALDALKKVMGIQEEEKNKTIPVNKKDKPQPPFSSGDFSFNSGYGPFKGGSQDNNSLLGTNGVKFPGINSIKDSDTATATSVTSQEKARENITITINKLVEHLDIHTTNLEGSSAEIQKYIAETLQEVVNNTRYAGHN